MRNILFIIPTIVIVFTASVASTTDLDLTIETVRRGVAIQDVRLEDAHLISSAKLAIIQADAIVTLPKGASRLLNVRVYATTSGPQIQVLDLEHVRLGRNARVGYHTGNLAIVVD